MKSAFVALVQLMSILTAIWELVIMVIILLYLLGIQSLDDIFYSNFHEQMLKWNHEAVEIVTRELQAILVILALYWFLK